MIDAIREYLDSRDYQALAKTTQSSYASALGRLDAFCDANDIDSIENFQENMDALARYLEQFLSGKSVQQYLNYIKIFLKASGNPVEYVYKIDSGERKSGQQKQMDRWFTEQEIAMCLFYEFPTYSPPDDLMFRIIIRLLIETGARVRELANASEKDIDIGDRTIYLYTSKTIPRLAFFSEKTQEALKSARDGTLTWQGIVGYTPKRIRTATSQMLEDLGLKNGKDGRGPHTFRHWTASYLYFVAKMRPHSIALLLGDKWETIRDTYLHPESFPLAFREEVTEACGW